MIVGSGVVVWWPHPTPQRNLSKHTQMHALTCLFLACQRWQRLHWMTGCVGCTSSERLTWPRRQSPHMLEALASKGMPLLLIDLLLREEERGTIDGWVGWWLV